MKTNKLNIVILIIAAILALVGYGLFTAFVLVAKAGLVPALIVSGACLPFLVAVFISYLPQKHLQ